MNNNNAQVWQTHYSFATKPAPERTINIIGNTETNHDNASVFSYYPTFNPLDKIIELYDALVKSEKEKNELLQKLLDEKK